MAGIRIEVGGRRYEVTCKDGEEERLRLVGRLVDARVTEIAKAIGRGNEARELLLAALLLADDLEEARATAAAGQIDEAKRVAAIDRCAERLEELATALDTPPADDGLEMPARTS